MQVNLVGKAQTSYLPGVLVPEVNAGGAAEQAGFKAGDIILRVGQYEVAATNKQVGCCDTVSSEEVVVAGGEVISGRQGAALGRGGAAVRTAAAVHVGVYV